MMQNANPITVSDEEQFVVGESNFQFFNDHPYRCQCGAILYCMNGEAEVSVNLHRDVIQTHAVMLLLPGAILMMNNISADFQISYCAFSSKLFSEAGYRLEPSFFRFLSDHPISRLLGDESRGVYTWLQVAAYTYSDRDNIFRNTIIKNRLQNMFLEVYDKLQRTTDFGGEVDTGRRMELFHKFIHLVREQCKERREVAYYADKLCISTRYLSSIARTVVHKSAKEIIDEFVVLEIKMLLQSTDLSAQEIADRLHFPDQSYMGHYFRRHTKQTPSEYRNQR
ncbi:MAG: helix-turn-helix domain-containing protein [Alistipes sp.]